MPDHFFISYSSVDGKDLSLKLADKLAAGPPSFSMWHDKRMLRPDDDWDSQIDHAIKTCKALLFLMTDDSVDDNSVCKNEWVQALRYKKPVIPVMLSKQAQLPFRLSSRQYINFTESFEAGLAALRDYLSSMDLPEGQLQALKHRLADANRDLKRARSEEEALIQEEIVELKRQIKIQQELINNPEGVNKRVLQNIEQGLQRERQPEKAVPAFKTRKFINPPPLIAPTWFQDRHIETRLIGEFLKDDSLRMMTVVGRGGIGKTAMVCRLLRSLEAGQLPDDNGPFSVDGIVYLSDARSFHRVKVPDLYSGLIQLLPEESQKRLEHLYLKTQASIQETMQVLLDSFPFGKIVVVLLDNFEDEVDIENGKIKDSELYKVLTTLLESTPHGLKVIITTRVAPSDLALIQPGLQQRINVDQGLKSPDAENVLRAMDKDGKTGLKDAPADLLKLAQERTRGYPRALEHLFGILSADRDTSLQEIVQNTQKLLPEQVVQVLVGEAFSRLDQISQRIMQALAVYRYPVPPTAIDYLLQPFVPGVNSGPALSRLVNMQFVHRDAGRYYLHQIDRDYALTRIPEGTRGDRNIDPPPYSFFALQHRAAEWFKLARKPRESWKKLDDLAAQLAEFELRFEGEDYDTAAAVVLEIDYNYLILWGHFKLVIDLHNRLQGKISDEFLKQNSVGNLGTAYFRMGQIDQAFSCYQQALEIARHNKDRTNEGVWLGNLGSVYGELGQINKSMEYEKQALAISREVGNEGSKATRLANVGMNYADMGQFTQAIESFKEALVIDKETGNREGTAFDLCFLGLSYAALGDFTKAMEYFKKEYEIADEIGSKLMLSEALLGMGLLYQEEEKWEDAKRVLKQAIDIGDEIQSSYSQAKSRRMLGQTYLYQEKLKEARELLEAALPYDTAFNNFRTSLLLGITAFLQSDTFAAEAAFKDAINKVDSLISNTPELYEARDTRGLALCGLALCGHSGCISDAKEAFHFARMINSFPGSVNMVRRLFNILAKADTTGVLKDVRSFATKEKHKRKS